MNSKYTRLLTETYVLSTFKRKKNKFEFANADDDLKRIDKINYKIQ
jgi:hypothetical protein